MKLIKKIIDQLQLELNAINMSDNNITKVMEAVTTTFKNVSIKNNRLTFAVADTLNKGYTYQRLNKDNIVMKSNLNINNIKNMFTYNLSKRMVKSYKDITDASFLKTVNEAIEKLNSDKLLKVSNHIYKIVE